jgi:hypothetical protein
MPAAERFTFISFDAPGPPGAASCDGLVPGTALHLSHWEGNRTPAELKADTSVEIALRFAKGGGAIDLVVNNHFDADGALAVFALLRSDAALAHADLLIAAAEAGDFDEWPVDERGLKLEAVVRRLALLKTDAAAYVRVVRELEDILVNLEAREDLWGETWRGLERGVARLSRGDVSVTIEEGLATFVHAEEIAELPGPVLHRAAKHAAALARVDVPTRWLLAWDKGGGRFEYRYELARHSWADTVVRPTLVAPSRNAVATRLAAALGVPFEAWALKGDLGMTGVLRSRAPIAHRPERVARALGAPA